MIYPLIDTWGSIVIAGLLFYSIFCLGRYTVKDHRSHTSHRPHLPFIQKCKQHNRAFCWGCLGYTVGFPLEHLLWIYAPGFGWITSVLKIG